MNTPVNFQIAKLLREKGYNIPCLGKYIDGIYYKSAFGETSVEKYQPRLIDAPTISEVVMWLHEKHGIWIGVQPNEPYVDDDWCFTIFKDLKNNISLEGYNSPTEAYEAAIVLCIK